MKYGKRGDISAGTIIDNLGLIILFLFFLAIAIWIIYLARRGMLKQLAAIIKFW